MTMAGSAGMNGQMARWRLRLSAALLALFLLAVPAGLAFHSASHAHGVDEYSDCSLCILGAHFSAEILTVQIADDCLPNTPREDDDLSHPTTNEFSGAKVRGPPATSV